MVQRTATTKVRNTNLTYRDLCCMRRIKGVGQLKAGAILARDGAWQNKRVVEYVQYMGVQDVPCYSGTTPRHMFAIGFRPLGKFYADGRMKISSKQELSETHILLEDPSKCGRSIGGWCIVEPIPVEKRAIGSIDSTKGPLFYAQIPGEIIIADPVVGRLCRMEPQTESELWAYNRWAEKVGRPLKEFTTKYGSVAGVVKVEPRHHKDPAILLDEFALKGAI